MEHVMCMAILEPRGADPNPQSGAVEGLNVDPTEILALEEDPTEETALPALVEPPSQRLRGNDGVDVVEKLSLVGWVEAPKPSREQLEAYGIDLREATFDPKTARWNGCLFSQEVATLLEELATAGQFRFPFSVR